MPGDTETRLPPEAQKSPEIEAFAKAFAAAHPRVLASGIVGKEVLNPGNAISEIKAEHLGDIDHRSYQIFSNASFGERVVPKNEFDARKQAWIASTVNTFKSGKGFFAGAEGQKWAKVLARAGINALEFDKSQAEQFYQTYLSEDKNGQKMKSFVKTIISSPDYSHNDVDAIFWVANVFGEKSAEVVTHLAIAEKNLQDNPDQILSLANEEIKVKEDSEETIKRINLVQPREEAILRFLYNSNTQSTNPSPQPKTTPPENTPPQTTEPTTTPNPTRPNPAAPPNPDQPTTPEQKTQAEEIIAGQGFEVVKKIGWPAYREALSRISYKDMITHKLAEIAKLEEAAKNEAPPLSGAELEAANKMAREEITRMRTELPQQLAGETNFKCWDANPAGAEKLVIRGKDVDMKARPMTRLYLHTYNRTTPEAYLALFEALKNNGSIKDVDLILNTENFTEASDKTVLNNNNIILYIPGQNPQVMEKITQAIAQAKQKNPAVFALHPQDEINAKTQLMYNFNIPLDDTTGFVEMPTGNSYDESHRKTIGRELYPNYNNIPQNLSLTQQLSEMTRQLAEITQRIPEFQDQNPTRFTDPTLAQRRKYMPALLFEEATVAPDQKTFTPELISETEADKILLHTEIHGMDYKTEPLTREVLTNEGLKPKFKVTVDDTTICFSPVYDSEGGRIAVVGYVKDKAADRYVARTYYRSNSHGVWKYLPAYTTDSDGDINWYMKGFGEESIQSPIGFQQALAQISKNEGEIIGLDLNKRDLVFAGTARDISKPITFVREVDRTPVRLNGLPYSPDHKKKIKPESLILTPAQSPDFSKPLSSWQQKTSLYGDINIDVFPSSDGKLKFMFCRDLKGRAWIGGIEDTSEIKTTGVRQSWINAGDLSTPAYEYTSQADTYGNDVDKKPPYIDVFQNYLSKIPVIQEYLNSVTTPLAKAA